MRREIVLILLLATVLSMMFSCASADADDPDKLTVITTIFPQYDFVRAIAGDLVEVEMLLSPKSESHTYEPSMADIAKISRADLFIYTGGGIDTWAEDITAALADSDMRSMAISDSVTLMCHDDGAHEHGDAHGHDHSHDHDHGDGDACVYDEHVWTSPKNAILIFDSILDTLCELDPDNAEVYRDNAAVYRAELELLDHDLHELVAMSARDCVIFADRFPFLYLTEEYGLDYHAALSGCSIGQEPTAAVIAEMIELAGEEKLGYVFIIENSEGKVAELISEAVGCGILTLHSCHNVSREDFSAGVTYVSLMKQNIENLRLALN